MPTDQSLERIIRALSDPGFYPHDTTHIEVRQTHISVVFLTGRWVYKIKKARNLGFLDFTTLENRKACCRQEILLNQRLSTGVYQEVVPIWEDSRGQLTLRPRERIVEYAVKMKQLPDESNLCALLRHRHTTTIDINTLGRTLARFHAQARRSTYIDSFGDPEMLLHNMEENFEQIRPFVRGRMDDAAWEFVSQTWRAYWRHHQELLRGRIAQGRIRDGHGDLKAEHIYLNGDIQIIDCIEFNERFRYGDSMLDLAFLIMDLEHLGYPDAAREILAIYAQAAHDPEAYALLDFYAAYRAVVRLKVSCLSLEHTDAPKQVQLDKDIRRYLEQSFRYALSFGRPALWVFFGLPASGKSTLAGHVSRALHMPLLQTDSIRKTEKTTPDESIVPYGTGMYSPTLRGRVYARMLGMAQDQLKSGRSVALDATFSETRWRQEARQLAADLQSSIIFVQCTCELETIRQRLIKRETMPGDSDARLMHLNDMVRHFKPMHDESPDMFMEVHTDQDMDQAVFTTLRQGTGLLGRQIDGVMRDLATGAA